MQTELFALCLAGLLLIVHLLAGAGPRLLTFGVGWAQGPRDETPGALSPLAGRADRAARNFLETFPLFAAVALGVVVAGATSGLTAAGAVLYLVARVLYLPAYLFHVPFVRSTLWAVSMLGILALLVPLLLAAAG